MSAFLGPIHFWLYRKIKLQQSLADYIVDNSSISDKDKLYSDAEKLFGKPETRELEEVIDEHNIHGWLQEQVSIVENRLAYFVTNIIKESTDSVESLAELAVKYGELNRIPRTESAMQAFKEIDDRLLSGMPCDRVNQVTEQTESEVDYGVVNDIHEEYWIKNNGRPEDYYIIIEGLIRGLLSDCPLSFVKIADRQYRISRKVGG